MTRDEAKFLLSARRPNGADDADPQMAEALAQAKQDPELTRWLAASVEFDQAVTTRLTALPPPADLKQRILAGRSVAHFPATTARRRVWALSAAALVAGLLGLAALWWQQRPPTLATLKGHLAEYLEKDWNHAFDLSNSDFATIHDWLRAQPRPVHFAAPAGLAAGRTYGCKTFECCGLPATMVCFTPKGGTTVVHVFRVQATALPDAPTKAPQFTRINQWTAASWAGDDEVYVAFTTASPEELARWL